MGGGSHDTNDETEREREGFELTASVAEPPACQMSEEIVAYPGHVVTALAMQQVVGAVKGLDCRRRRRWGAGGRV